MPENWCPFCPGSGRVPDGYDVLLYPNDYPAFSLEGAPFDVQGGLFRVTGAKGTCDVVIYHSSHSTTPSALPVEQWRKVIELWTLRTAELSALPEIACVFVFENTGEAIGVTMPHPHGQIYGFPFVPPLLRTELDSARAHHASSGECLYCHILRDELEDGRRVVCRNANFVAFVPFFARFPAEVQLYPRRHYGGLREMDQNERNDLASLLSTVRRKYDNLFGFPMPLMMMVRQSPVQGSHEYFHFHVEFFPIQRSAAKLKYLAGVESGSGTFLNDTVAEECALRLRSVEPLV